MDKKMGMGSILQLMEHAIKDSGVAVSAMGKVPRFRLMVNPKKYTLSTVKKSKFLIEKMMNNTIIIIVLFRY